MKFPQVIVFSLLEIFFRTNGILEDLLLHGKRENIEVLKARLDGGWSTLV